jgi:hypothetical protein
LHDFPQEIFGSLEADRSTVEEFDDQFQESVGDLLESVKQLLPPCGAAPIVSSPQTISKQLPSAPAPPTLALPSLDDNPVHMDGDASGYLSELLDSSNSAVKNSAGQATSKP